MSNENKILVIQPNIFIVQLFLLFCFVKKLIFLNSKLYLCDNNTDFFFFKLRFELSLLNLKVINLFDWFPGGLTNFSFIRWKYLKNNYPIFFDRPDYFINFTSKYNSENIWGEALLYGCPFLSIVEFDFMDAKIDYHLLGGGFRLNIFWFYFNFFLILSDQFLIEKNKTIKLINITSLFPIKKKVKYLKRKWRKKPKRFFFKRKKNRLYFLLLKKFGFKKKKFHLKLKYLKKRNSILIQFILRHFRVNYRQFNKPATYSFLSKAMSGLRKSNWSGGSRYSIFMSSIECRLNILIWRLFFFKKQYSLLSIFDFLSSFFFYTNGIQVKETSTFYVPYNSVISWSYLIDSFSYIKTLKSQGIPLLAFYTDIYPNCFFIKSVFFIELKKNILLYNTNNLSLISHKKNKFCYKQNLFKYYIKCVSLYLNKGLKWPLDLTSHSSLKNNFIYFIFFDFNLIKNLNFFFFKRIFYFIYLFKLSNKTLNYIYRFKSNIILYKNILYFENSNLKFKRFYYLWWKKTSVNKNQILSSIKMRSKFYFFFKRRLDQKAKRKIWFLMRKKKNYSSSYYLTNKYIFLKKFYRDRNNWVSFLANYFIILNSWIRVFIFIKPPTFNSIFFTYYGSRIFMRYLSNNFL